MNKEYVCRNQDRSVNNSHQQPCLLESVSNVCVVPTIMIHNFNAIVTKCASVITEYTKYHEHQK